ncbi:MAG: PLD nuclease N-terminal domain-containing protein [Tepidisphaeraceae bacterium]
MLSVGMPGPFELLLLLAFAAAWLLPIVAIIDLVRRRFIEPNMKIVWLLIVLFVPVIGSILYFLIGRDQSMAD